MRKINFINIVKIVSIVLMLTGCATNNIVTNQKNTIPLTTQIVQEVLDNIIISTNKKDIDGATKDMAKDVKISLILPKVLGGELNPKLEVYKSLMKFSWNNNDIKFKYLIEDIVIKLNENKDGAIVTLTAIEKISFKGGRYKNATSDEKITFKYENNKLVIVEVISKLNKANSKAQLRIDELTKLIEDDNTIGSIKFIQNLCEKDKFSYACKQLVSLYYHGDKNLGVKKNDIKAAYYTNVECTNGNGAACHDLGNEYMRNSMFKLKQNISKSILLHKRGCDLKYDKSCEIIDLLDGKSEEQIIEMLK